ncbi:MAG: CarD family transcriptional regulator [Solirubrobacteraceae bacterium]
MEEQLDELDELESEPAPNIEFEIGDSVVYPHHGAGKVLRKEVREILGESREYLTIKILHNDMTVMVPTENAALAGLRRVIDEETVQKVLAVLSDECSEMPKNWNRRFKHNRDKIKTGDIYELAEVVRNLAIREADKGLSTGEKQMYTRAKKILASELMYALGMNEEQVEEHLHGLLAGSSGAGRPSGTGGSQAGASANGRAHAEDVDDDGEGDFEADDELDPDDELAVAAD